MAGLFQQRTRVFAWSEYRPLNDKRPIGTAVSETGAKRVYWAWERGNFQPGQRWYPKSMTQDGQGDWFLKKAIKK